MSPSLQLEALLAAGLEELPSVPEESRPGLAGKLAALTLLLASWAQRLNLTGHRGPEAIARFLVLDAAALAEQLPLLGSLVDLGSGAGFPGLPIAILRPSLQVTLVEARRRRHHFQRAAARALALPNVRPLLGRAEQLEPSPAEAVVAQAVARPGKALAWMTRWASRGGLLILPGGEDLRVEVDPALGVVELGLRRYQVPLQGPKRSFWLGKME